MLQRQKGWLDEQVVLPGDYKTSRRDLLKFFPLLGALGSAYALSQNQKVRKTLPASPKDAAPSWKLLVLHMPGKSAMLTLLRKKQRSK